MASILDKSVGGAALLLLSTVGQRILTFVLNALITRAAGAKVLGFASNDMELLLATILFITREPFRLSGLRCSPSNRRRAQSLVNQSWAPVLVGTVAVKVAILVILFGFSSPSSELGPDSEASMTEASASSQRSATALMFVLGAWLELLAEPMYILTQSELMYELRVRAEGLGVLLKSGLAYALVVHGGLGPTAFGVAQLGYGAAVLGVFLWHFASGRARGLQSMQMLRSSPGAPAGTFLGVPLPAPLEGGEQVQVQEEEEQNRQEKDEGDSEVETDGQRHEVGKDNGAAPGWVLALSPLWAPWVDRRDAGLIGALSLEGLAKHFITQGDRIVLLASADEETRGLWAVVSSYGSLAPRLLFQSIEEAARGLFGRIAAETEGTERGMKQEIEQENGEDAGSGEGGAADQEGQEQEKGKEAAEGLTRAAEVSTTASANANVNARTNSNTRSSRMAGALEIVMWTVSLVGLLFVALGSSYTELATNVVLGPRFPHSGTMLSYYCLYVLFMAINGALESFVHAVASHEYIASLAWQLALSSALFAGASTLALRAGGGIVGVVLANCFATAVRIGFALWFVAGWFGRSASASASASASGREEGQGDRGGVDEAGRSRDSGEEDGSGGHKNKAAARSDGAGTGEDVGDAGSASRKDGEDGTGSRQRQRSGSRSGGDTRGTAPAQDKDKDKDKDKDEGRTPPRSLSMGRLLPSFPTLLAIVAAFCTTHASWVWFREPDPWALGPDGGVGGSAEAAAAAAAAAALHTPFGAWASPARPVLARMAASGIRGLPEPPPGCGCCQESGCIVPWKQTEIGADLSEGRREGESGGQGGEHQWGQPLHTARGSWWGCRLRHLAVGAGAFGLVAMSLLLNDRQRVLDSARALREGRQAARG